MPSKLSIQSVSKSFRQPESSGSILAVDNVTLDIPENAFVSIVGPSGCGKSTLLNVVAGLEEPSAGQILIDGDRVRDRTTCFGYMFQKDLLFPWRTIEENVALALDVRGDSKRSARAAAATVLERFGMGQFRAMFPSQLSGGMRQRVAIMRTLIGEKETLLLDEPFGALDAMTRAEMQRWLLDIWHRHRRTVLFVTHDLDEAIYLSDTVILMSPRPGRISAEYPVDMPRPRDDLTTTSMDFVNLKRAILNDFKEQHVFA